MIGFSRELGATLRLATPLIAAQLLMVVMGFIDTVMAGRIGPLQLAAVAMGSSLWLFVFLACTGLLMGLSPVFAQLLGAGRLRAMAQQFQQGIWFALLVAVLSFLAIRAMSGLMPWFGVDAQVIPVASAYLDAISWGMPAVCLYMVPRYLCEGMGNTRPLMLVQLVLLPVGVFGNYVFMYGHFGAPALGAVGAGVSTAIGFWLSAGLMLAYVLKRRRFKSLDLLQDFARPDRRAILNLAALGLPISISLMLETGLFATMTLLMGSLGAIALAAHQIALNYASLTFMVPLGISMATTVRVGQALGADDRALARRRGFAGIVLGAAAMLISASLILGFPGVIIGFYTADAEVAAVAGSLLFAAALFQLSDGLQVTAAGALRGYKDVKLPMLLNAFAYWMVGLPLAWWFGVHGAGNPAGLWYGLVAGLSSAAFLLNLRFQRLSRLDGD